MLHSVPNQATRAADVTGAHVFRERVEQALGSGMAGPELAKVITDYYAADTAALEARAYGAAREASESADAARTATQLAQQLHGTAAHKMWETARVCAQLSHYATIIERVRSLIERSDGHRVDVPLLMSAVTHEPPEPVYQPTVTAFTPDSQYRAGEFASPDGSETCTFPFVGWALVDHGPGAYGVTEPMFLVGDKVLPKSAVQADRNLRFTELLPRLDATRAA